MRAVLTRVSILIPVDLSQIDISKGLLLGFETDYRDGAQSLIYSHPLWGITQPSNYHSFRRRFDDIYD